MTSVVPAHRAAPQMTQTPDPTAVPQAEAGVAAVEAGSARPRLRDQIAENPLMSLFGGLMAVLGTVVVALLVFTLTGINDRFDRVEMRLGERIAGVEMRLGERIDGVEMRLGERIDDVEARLGERIDRLQVDMDAGFVAQGTQIAEADRKLTALVAHLNAKESVDAALEGRLLIPDAATTEP